MARSSRRILYTAPGAAVGVLAMTAWCHRALTCGGGWLSHVGSSVAREVAKAEARGADPETERRFAFALEHGGCTDAEAWDLIRRRDLPADAAAAELVDLADLPADRWFRDAWRRSPNGGPVWIDLERARDVQRAHVAGLLAQEAARRARALAVPPETDIAALRRAIEAAATLDELRAALPAVST